MSKKNKKHSDRDTVYVAELKTEPTNSKGYTIDKYRSIDFEYLTQTCPNVFIFPKKLSKLIKKIETTGVSVTNLNFKDSVFTFVFTGSLKDSETAKLLSDYCREFSTLKHLCFARWLDTSNEETSNSEVEYRFIIDIKTTKNVLNCFYGDVESPYAALSGVFDIVSEIKQFEHFIEAAHKAIKKSKKKKDKLQPCKNCKIYKKKRD